MSLIVDTRLSELKGNVGPCQRYALYSAILVIIIIIIMTSVKNWRPSVNICLMYDIIVAVDSAQNDVRLREAL